MCVFDCLTTTTHPTVGSAGMPQATASAHYDVSQGTNARCYVVNHPKRINACCTCALACRVAFSDAYHNLTGMPIYVMVFESFDISRKQ